jgi:sec-independent protein translocase protein TatA
MGLRMPELILIFVIILVLFGANKLPQLGAGLGQGIKSFKKALGGDDEKPAAQNPPTDQGSKQA